MPFIIADGFTLFFSQAVMEDDQIFDVGVDGFVSGDQPEVVFMIVLGDDEHRLTKPQRGHLEIVSVLG